MEVRIISIGALAAHPLWQERGAARTGHATTTLIRSGDRVILVDPGLPAQAIAARLGERSGLRPEAVTDVFLTSFQADTARGITAFEGARWLIHGAEREGVGVPLALGLRRAIEDGEEEAAARLRREVAILERCRPAPDRLAEHVDIFPLPGATPGTCGVLVSEARCTTLVCGDAVPTVEHLERGMTLPHCADLARAKESLMEAVEIADLLVPGRDNIVMNQTKRPF